MPKNPKLSDVNRVYPGWGPPLLGTAPERKRGPNPVAALLARPAGAPTPRPEAPEPYSSGETHEDVIDQIQEELVYLGQSLRESVTRPNSPLHVLLLVDNIDLPEVAALMRADPRDIEISLDRLVQIGLVSVDLSGPLPTYSVRGLPADQRTSASVRSSTTGFTG